MVDIEPDLLGDAGSSSFWRRLRRSRRSGDFTRIALLCAGAVRSYGCCAGFVVHFLMIYEFPMAQPKAVFELCAVLSPPGPPRSLRWRGCDLRPGRCTHGTTQCGAARARPGISVSFLAACAPRRRGVRIPPVSHNSFVGCFGVFLRVCRV